MCSSLAKCLLFTANLVFFLAGGTLLGLGIFYQIEYSEVTQAIPDSYNIEYAPISVIVVGSVILVIAFLGCCGASQENRCMLMTYGLILFVLLVAQIAIGVYALVEIKRSDTDTTFESALRTTVTELFSNYDNTNEVVDYIQSEFTCCGTDSYSFWNSSIPNSCCGSGSDQTCTSSNAYQRGCISALNEFLTGSINVIAGVAIGVVATEILGMIFAWGLARSIKKKGYYY